MAGRHQAILLFGAPGVGKGTQGMLLGHIPGYCHLATGDMFRSLDKESPLGQQFLEYSSRGELVPDELTIQLWQQYVQQLIDEGKYNPQFDLLVLDGLPRSVNQAEVLRDYADVLAVIHLDAPDIEEMVERMKRRAIQQNRHDDADETVIRRRFQVFDRDTAPVLQQYDPSIVYRVNAVGSPARVLLDVLQITVPVSESHYANPLANA